MASITPEEIKALVGAKIKGQGTAVDMGSVLPAILNGLADNISDLINNKGLQFGGVLALDASAPYMPNAFYLLGPGVYDDATVPPGEIGVMFSDEDGHFEKLDLIKTSHSFDEIAEIAKVSSGIIITYDGVLEVGVATELNGIKPDDIPYVNAIIAPRTGYGRFNVLTPMKEGNTIYIIENLFGGDVDVSTPDKAYFCALADQNEGGAGISLTVSNGKVMIKFAEV